MQFLGRQNAPKYVFGQSNAPDLAQLSRISLPVELTVLPQTFSCIWKTYL